MTKTEALQTRVVIAQLFDIPPDDVDFFEAEHSSGVIHFYEIPYGESTLAIGLRDAQTVEKLSETIQELTERVDSWMEEEGEQFI